jgi:hypothetical protein
MARNRNFDRNFAGILNLALLSADIQPSIHKLGGANRLREVEMFLSSLGCPPVNSGSCLIVSPSKFIRSICKGFFCPACHFNLGIYLGRKHVPSKIQCCFCSCERFFVLIRLCSLLQVQLGGFIAVYIELRLNREVIVMSIVILVASYPLDCYIRKVF